LPDRPRWRRDRRRAATSTQRAVAIDARVQEVHRTILHVICELVEAGLF